MSKKGGVGHSLTSAILCRGSINNHRKVLLKRKMTKRENDLKAKGKKSKRKAKGESRATKSVSNAVDVSVEEHSDEATQDLRVRP